MPHKLLLPNRFKLIGWFIFIPTTILGLLQSFNNFNELSLEVKTFAFLFDEGYGKTHSFGIIETDITNTIIGVLFIIGAMLVGFSKEKIEDEFIAKLRLSSLLWAVWVNYILLFVCFLFIYDSFFFNVMVYNMFTVLIIFIARFNFILYNNSKAVSDEK